MATYREQIKQFFAKTFKGNFIEVCKPKQYLLSLGLPKLPIYIRPSTLSEKVKKHLLTSDMIKNLPADINAPILAFKSDIYTGGINLIIQKKNEEGLLCVCLHPNIRANKTEINEIASIHGRQFHQLEMWANLGLLLSGNVQKTKKALQWLAVTSAKSERFIAQLSAANIQNNSLGHPHCDEDDFYIYLVKKYGKKHKHAEDSIFDFWLSDSRYGDEIAVPFPDDWKRVAGIELDKYAKDGDIFGEYLKKWVASYIPDHDSPKHIYKRYFRAYTDNKGILRCYELDEQGNPVYLTKDEEQIYFRDKDNPIYNGDRIIEKDTNGKYYHAYKLGTFGFDFQVYHLKPRTTAPTNSRLRLLRIQAQAKIKLQQQRMR